MLPGKLRKKRKRKEAPTEFNGEDEGTEMKDEGVNLLAAADNPDVKAPEDKNKSNGILTKTKLAAKDHILITAGPAEFLEEPQPWHGGRLDNDKFGLEPASTCTKGAFVKPWLRVPAGGYVNKSRRDSTDKFPVRLLTFLWIVCIFAGVFGYLEGNLTILAVGGQDMVGNTCGDTASVAPPAVLLTDLKYEWSELKYLWYPIDPDVLGEGLDNIIKYGICVSECPKYEQNVAVHIRFREGVKQYMWEWDVSSTEVGCKNSAKCRTTNYCSRNPEAGCVRSFRVMYPSTLLHRQCVPDIYSNGSTEIVDANVAPLMHELSNWVSYHKDWWFSVTADCYAARNVILAGSVVTFVYGEVYLLLMKKSPLYVSWGSVVLLVASSITTALFLLEHKAMLQTTTEQKFLMRKRYENQFSTFAYVLIIVGSINAVMCLLLRKKVVIASDMMRESGKVLKQSPGISAIAPFMWLLQIMVLALAYIAILFIGSIGLNSDLQGNSYTNILHNTDLYHLKPKDFNLLVARTPFQAMCLVVVIWSLGLVNMIGYSFTTFISCMWYFSKPGEPKLPPRDGVWITFHCVQKHVGSCAVGAVILTLFESIRSYLEKIQALLRTLLDKLPRALFFFTCIIHYILMLFDKGLKLVRRDAFCVQCIEGSDFFHAARRAGRLYDLHKNEVGMVAEVSENVALFGRLGILSITLLTTTFLLLKTPMGEGIDNPVIIVVLISACSFFVSTLFAQITNATMDAFLMCYCYDMEVNDGSIRRPFFTHPSLKEFLDQHASFKNEYRNIYAGNDLTLGNFKTQILDAKQKVEETLKDAEKTTKKTAKQLRNTTVALADEVGNTAKKGAEASRKAAEKTFKAAEQAAHTVEDGAKSGASTLSKTAQKSVKRGGILSKATSALGGEIQKAKHEADGRHGSKRARGKYGSSSPRSKPSNNDLRAHVQGQAGSSSHGMSRRGSTATMSHYERSGRKDSQSQGSGKT